MRHNTATLISNVNLRCTFVAIRRLYDTYVCLFVLSSSFQKQRFNSAGVDTNEDNSVTIKPQDDDSKLSKS